MPVTLEQCLILQHGMHGPAGAYAGPGVHAQVSPGCAVAASKFLDFGKLPQVCKAQTLARSRLDSVLPVRSVTAGGEASCSEALRTPPGAQCPATLS